MSDITPITAAGGLVYKSQKKNQPQVLLIFRNGVWDLPKGKMEDETVQECAVREVAEEIGSSEFPIIKQKLTETYHEYEQEGVRYGKTTYWFSMQFQEIDDSFNPQTEEGIEKVKWVPLTKAKELVGYENLVGVLKSFERLC